jgi:transcriptional regulator with XRE-family HTH domain
MAGEPQTGQTPPTFAALLKQLRAEARLTQEELASAAGLSPRSISDLERGISRTARKDTARLIADALAITGPVRERFVTAARGRAEVCEVLAVRDTSPADFPAPVLRTDHRSGRTSLSCERDLREAVDAMMAASASNGIAITGIWLIALTAKDANQLARPEPMTASPPLLASRRGACGSRDQFRGRNRIVQRLADGQREN